MTARAVARLSTLAELASPLLVDGGHLLAWKGRRDPDEDPSWLARPKSLAMEPLLRSDAVGPYAGSRQSPPTPDPQERPDPGGPAAATGNG